MNKAIVVFVVLILLAVLVSWMQREEPAPAPDMEPKTPPVTLPVIPPVNQAERAKRELALLDEALLASKYGLEIGRKHPITDAWHKETAQATRDVLDGFRGFVERVPKWREPIQRVADGDSSAIAAMDTAIGQWKASYDELDRKINAMSGGPKTQTLGMTMDGYEALQSRMRKMEVDLILGCAGVEQSRSGNLTIYAWQEGFSQIIVTFENDKLVAKTQSGL